MIEPGFGNIRLLPNASDKAQALAWQGFDKPLLLAIVTKRERAALIRVLSADSETMRPCHTEARRSSLLTTCSRFRIR